MENNEKKSLNVGNFVIERDDMRVIVRDVQDTVRWEVPTTIAKGQYLDMACTIMEAEGLDAGFLHAICATAMNFLCCIPDPDLLFDVQEAVLRCIDRHKDIYGIEDEVDPAKDAEDLRDAMETVEAVRKLNQEKPQN